MTRLPPVSENKVLAVEWDYDKNDISPDDVTQGSNVAYWWKCKNNHEWQAKVNNRLHGNGCPYCANKKALPRYNDLATNFPAIAQEWNYKRNHGACPEQYLPKSHKKVWWICKQGHEWEAIISNRTNHGRGCPYCAGQRVIGGENDLLTISPELAAEWDYEKNGDLTPALVMPGTSRMVWWKCALGHSWKAAVNSRKKHGCPVCSGRQVISGGNDLRTLMPKIAREWDYEKNKNLRPEDISAQSNQIVWWRCENGHSWKAKPCERYRGNGCPKCDGRIKMVTHFMS